MKDVVDEEPGKDNAANQYHDLNAYQNVPAFVDNLNINVSLSDAYAHIKSLVQGACSSIQRVLRHQVHGSSDQVHFYH